MPLYLQAQKGKNVHVSLNTCCVEKCP